MRAPVLMWVVMGMVLCNMTAFRGSKVLITLFSIELGASKILIGVLVALYSLFPMLLGLYAGKLTDRLGVRIPVVAGSSAMAVALAVPFLFPALPALYVQAVGVGAGHVFYNVAIQNLIGGLGGGADRTRNFANFALAMSVGSFLGPLVSGFAIDHFGYAWSYLVIAVFPLLTIVIILSARALPGLRGKGKSGKSGKAPATTPVAAHVDHGRGHTHRHRFVLFLHADLRSFHRAVGVDDRHRAERVFGGGVYRARRHTGHRQTIWRRRRAARGDLFLGGDVLRHAVCQSYGFVDGGGVCAGARHGLRPAVVADADLQPCAGRAFRRSAGAALDDQ